MKFPFSGGRCTWCMRARGEVESYPYVRQEGDILGLAEGQVEVYAFPSSGGRCPCNICSNKECP